MPRDRSTSPQSLPAAAAFRPIDPWWALQAVLPPEPTLPAEKSGPCCHIWGIPEFPQWLPYFARQAGPGMSCRKQRIVPFPRFRLNPSEQTSFLELAICGQSRCSQLYGAGRCLSCRISFHATAAGTRRGPWHRISGRRAPRPSPRCGSRWAPECWARRSAGKRRFGRRASRC